MRSKHPGSGEGERLERARGAEDSGSGHARLPWVVLGLVLIVMAVGRYLEYRVNGEPPDGWVADTLMGIAFMSFPAMGALIVSRRRGHGFGWLLLAIGGAAAVLVAASGYAAWRVPAGHDDALTVLAAWIYQWLWFPLILSVPTFLVLLFPTGSYPSARWRWVGRATLLFMAIITIPAMLEDKLVVEDCAERGGRTTCRDAMLDNPIGVGFFTDVEQQLGVVFFAVFPLVVLSLASLVFRYRSAGTIERLQMKWVGVAAVFFGLALLLGDSVGISDRLFPVFLMMLPLSMGVSILKYRLYEIDVILNRALVYGLLSAILVGAYLGTVFALQNVLGPLTQDSDIAVAGSTLAVAALFRPLRSRVQEFIDRRFYRRKYNAQLTLENFAAHLRDEVDLDHLAHDLADVVRDTMQPSHVSVWLRPAGAVQGTPS